MPPPWHGSSPAQFVCGGAQRGVSLARGFFTGEATWKPPWSGSKNKVLQLQCVERKKLALKVDS
jgi:hypothetical protein